MNTSQTSTARRRVLLTAVAAAVTLAAAACSSSDADTSADDAAAGTTTPVTAAPSEPSSPTTAAHADTTAPDTTQTPTTTTNGSGDGAADTTAAPTTAAPTTVPPPVGADSSEQAIRDWFDGMASNDLAAMWAALDPAVRNGVSRAEWDACIAEQLAGSQFDSISYDENERYTDNGATYSTGTGTIRSGGDDYSEALTLEVVERAGGWFLVRPLSADADTSCVAQASNTN